MGTNSERRRRVTPADDIQTILDGVTNRAMTIEFEREPEQYPLSDPIYIGQMTVLRGDVASKRGFIHYDFETPHVLRFEAGTPGIVSDPDTDYQHDRCKIENLTLVGTGTSNGAAGIDFVGGADLWDVRQTWIGYFEQAANGQDISDSCNFYRCEIHHCGEGLVRLGTENKIQDCMFWEIEDGPAVQFVGHGGHVEGCEIQVANPITCVEVTGDGPTGELIDHLAGLPEANYTGRGTRIVNNSFQVPNEMRCGIHVANCKSVVAVGNAFFGHTNGPLLRIDGTDSYNNVFVGNVAEGDVESQNAIEVYGDRNLIADNSFAALDGTQADRLIDIEGDENAVVRNLPPGSGCSEETIRVQSGADNYLHGSFPNGVADDGIRTVINDQGQNNGNPALEGDWHGHAERAFRQGLLVWDVTTEPWTAYRAEGLGNWLTA